MSWVRLPERVQSITQLFRLISANHLGQLPMRIQFTSLCSGSRSSLSASFSSGSIFERSFSTSMYTNPPMNCNLARCFRFF